MNLWGTTNGFLSEFNLGQNVHNIVLMYRGDVLGRKDQTTPSSLDDVATVLSKQRTHVEAEQMHQESLQRSQKTLGMDHSETCEAADKSGDTLATQGK